MHLLVFHHVGGFEQVLDRGSDLALFLALLVIGRFFGVLRELYLAPMRRVLPPRAAILVAFVLAAWSFWAMLREPMTGWLAPTILLAFCGAFVPASRPLLDAGAWLNFNAHRPAYDAIVAEAARRGLILLSCGVYGNVIRILVPLTASDAVLAVELDAGAKVPRFAGRVIDRVSVSPNTPAESRATASSAARSAPAAAAAASAWATSPMP